MARKMYYSIGDTITGLYKQDEITYSEISINFL